MSAASPSRNNVILKKWRHFVGLYSRWLGIILIASAIMEARAGFTNVILLDDTFDVSSNSIDINFELPLRQTGNLATVTYSKAYEPIFSQVGNPGASNVLLLAGRTAGLPGAVSLDHNFVEAPGLGAMSVIEFEVNPVKASPEANQTQSSWVAITFGSSSATRNQFLETDGVGILFRGSGEFGAISAGLDIGVGSFAPGIDDLLHQIRIEIIDYGDDNPFDGDSPVTIRAFADNSASPFLSFVRMGGFQSNYISLIGEGEGSGGDGVVRHVVDNLRFSFEIVQPLIQTIQPAGANVMVNGIGGTPNGTYYVLASTNVAAPVGTWMRMATNTFSGTGHFIFTNAVTPGVAQKFYRLQLP